MRKFLALLAMALALTISQALANTTGIFIDEQQIISVTSATQDDIGSTVIQNDQINTTVQYQSAEQSSLVTTFPSQQVKSGEFNDVFDGIQGNDPNYSAHFAMLTASEYESMINPATINDRMSRATIQGKDTTANLGLVLKCPQDFFEKTESGIDLVVATAKVWRNKSSTDTSLWNMLRV